MGPSAVGRFWRVFVYFIGPRQPQTCSTRRTAQSLPNGNHSSPLLCVHLLANPHCPRTMERTTAPPLPLLPSSQSLVRANPQPEQWLAPPPCPLPRGEPVMSRACLGSCQGPRGTCWPARQFRVRGGYPRLIVHMGPAISSVREWVAITSLLCLFGLAQLLPGFEM